MIKKQFSDYFIDKLHETRKNITDDKPEIKKPFITISREYGCNAYPLAKNLADILSLYKTGNGKITTWKAVDQDILVSAAEQIGIDHSIIDQITFNNSKDYLTSFLNLSSSKYNMPSSELVKNAIKKIILNLADNGYCILIGRGGVTITRHIPSAIHIRLIAPVKWRALQIRERDKISLEKAVKLIKKIDKIRDNMRDYYWEKKKNTDIIFDLIFNAMQITQEEIIEVIKALLLKRGHLLEEK